jgi:superfamily I DNA and/or RNA helicase
MKYSVNKFYNGILGNASSKVYENPVEVVKVNGKVRSGKTINDAEVSKVIETIRMAMEDEKIESIGVLSPFREQCKIIEKAIMKEFTLAEIEKYSITVGTAHTFQGEEKDLMILSWTVADNSPFQSYTFINNPNLFNVSITRAKKKVVNLVSTSEPRGLLKEYLEQ